MNKVMYSSNTGEWETPKDFYKDLDAEFGFTLDPCCTDYNAKCEKHYTKEQDGLMQSWQGEVVWCNPPYGRDLANWVKKAYEENCRGATVVLLLPARTDVKWFHNYIYGKHEIRFVKGRLRFGGSKINAPFPSMIVVMRHKESVV